MIIFTFSWKRLVFLLGILLCLPNLTFSQITIDSEDFESGWGIWNDGGNDCSRGTPLLPNNNYAINLQDGSGVGSSMTTNNIDLTPYSSVDFTFDFEATGFSSGEDFWVQYSDNGGSTWNTIADYNNGTEFNNDIKYTPTLSIDTGSYTFSTNSQFRIRCDANHNNDDVFIDNVVITGYTPSVPEINIVGNGTSITDGDSTPSATDDTDFGNVDVIAGSNTHTFTIENLGTADLILTDASPYVVISGTNAADFTLTANPSTPISASGTTTFSITFNPSALGIRTATVSIANDDSDENPYNFDIQGNGTTTLPEINIQGNSTDISDGDITPTPTDDTDFGNVDVTAGSKANTFTIQNQGSSLSLNLTGASPYIVISGTHAADFTVTTIPANSIAAGSSTTFEITFNPSAVGLRTATLTIANNDSDENPYNFNIQGTGFIPPPCGTTVLHTADFETGLDGWTDGGADAARVNNAGRSYSNNYSLEIRNNDTSGNTSSFLSPLFDLSSYDKVDFKFFFTAYNHENSDNFFIEYSSDSGTSWTTIDDFIAGDISSKNGNYESTNTIIFYCKISTLLDSVHSFPSGNVSQFRVRSDASDTTDLVYIDNISITGVSYCTPTEGPGGITSDLDLWLKADQVDGFTVATDGSSVTSWFDSGKGNNAEPTVSSRAPIYKNNPTDNFNFNPVIYFDNDNATSSGDMTYLKSDRDVLQGTAGFDSNDMFVVIIPDKTVTNSMIPLDTFTGHDATGNTYSEDVTGFGYGSYTARLSGEYMAYCIGSTSSSSPYPGYGVGDTSASTDYNQIGIVNIRHNSSNNGMDLFLNGIQTDDIENDAADFSTVSNTRYFIGRSQYWSGSFEGRIAEIITYSSTKNDANDTSERNRIQSYLGIKYGITLAPDANGTTKDYVDSAGTVIWDQSANVGFNQDIAGIGRDDASELNQKQSSSVNYAVDGTGPTKGILSVGLTDIYNTNYDNQTSNATSFNDKEFLVWGNNGVSLDLAAATVTVDMSAGITPALSTDVTFTAMQRVWKFVETGGDVPEVKVSIPQNAIRNITPPGSYYMFISDTGVFDPTADYSVMTADGSGNLETTYDFDGTKYITFGYAPKVEVERSIYFDGSVDYVDVRNRLDLNTTEFTLSAWIKRDAADSGTASILSKRDAAFTEGYDLRILNDNRIEIIWKNGSDQSLISNTSIPDDEWHQVAAIYDGTTVSIYIDGVLDNSANLSAPTANSQHFYIAAAGKGSPTAHFRGNIDEVRVWDVGLSEDQLRFIMNQEIEDNATAVMGDILPTSITKNEVNSIAWSDLKGYFPMSVFTYTNVDDASGNGNQGALRNLDTVDRQTAPLPYESAQNGNWDLSTTWTNGNVQYIPGSPSLVDANVTVDWNIVRTSHDVTLDNSTLPAANNGNRTLLGLYIDANELTVTGNTLSNTGYGVTVSHYMNLVGKLDLEGESQLIQTSGSDLFVDTNGELERDQQGTADTFTYNYWSAPVGATDLGINNYRYTVQDIMYDGTNPINFSSTGYDGANSNPIKIADYWIWKYANLPSDTYSAWQHVRRTGTLNAGEGFTMKGPGSGPISADQNYVFLGKPNNADVNLTINAGNDYLVGNPYASAIDAVQFILDNGPTLEGGTGSGEDPLISGTLYFWEHWGGGSHYLSDYQGGYATYSLAGGTPAAAYGTNDPDVGTGGTPVKLPGRYIPVSQGFFVTAEANGTINFNNGQRVFQKEDASSVFVRSAENNIYAQEELEDDRTKIRIGFNSVNTFRRQLLLTIDPSTTQDIDWGYDAKLNESQKDDMYWVIEGEEYVIQSSDNIESGTVYPIGLKTDSDGFNTITLDHTFNLENNIKIYVHDKLLDTYTNLLTEDFEIFLNAGEYNDRFDILFARTGNYTLLDTDESSLEHIDIMYSNDLEKIVLINPNGIQIKRIELYNMLGQSILTINNVSQDGYAEYDVNNLSTGTYIIKLNTVSGSVSKKVIIK